MSAVRFLAIDIDGTLLDSHGRIPDRNRDAIGRALAAGVEVALVTGRAFHFARPVAERLGLPVQLIVSNGAIVKAMDGTSLLQRLLPAAVARAVLASTLEWRTDTAVVFDRPHGSQVVAGGMDWRHPTRVGYWTRNQSIIDEVIPLEDCIVDDPIQVMFNGGVERMRALTTHLHACPEPRPYGTTLTEYVERDFTLVDVLAAGVSKGATLLEWTGNRGLSHDQLMAVGDNYNDWDMLTVVGRPVVMGNAVPSLLDAGFAVTGSNDEAGLAQAIERFIL
jgi:hypothetical protein